MELQDSPSPLRPADENRRLAKGDGAVKGLSVEHIYQKKTQLEHILLRPDTYIGSVELVTQQMWVFDEGVGLNCRDVTFVPGLYKIFDEILVNAADNKQRDKNMSCIKVTIDVENNTISVWNNGKGIPVVEHKVEKVYVPALIFGQLLTSSNYDDNEKKVTGGRNGYGAKLCNIFSKKFTVETACREYKKLFKQTWTDNMGKAGEMKLKYYDGEDYTCVTFQPDLSKFKMTILDKDIVALMSRRAYDIAGSTKDVKVFLNGQRLPVKGFRSYVDLYLKDKVDETGNELKVIHEEVNSRWEVCLTLSEKGFQQVSFVNSIATTKGGRHVDYVADQLVTKIIEVVKKKNKNGVGVKPFQVKNHMWIFVNSLIENPTFDSQTKENMTLQAKNFGSTCKLSEKFIKGAVGCGIVESILNWVKFKAQSQLNKKCSAVKHTKIKGVPKLDDANDAGSKNSLDCTLILTEGDSAKTLAVSGLGVVGRDKYGVFPLRGKMLNVREASHKQIMENAEINNIIKIVGLQYKKNYEDQESLKTLRYGKIMIMTDQDQDGSHIKGLLINFIHHNWPSLLRHNFLEEFITPIIKVSKNKDEISFYSIPEFEEWKSNTQNYNSWKIKYYKDNERSIPSLVDGLKPGQRKVLFTCFKRNDKREVKVAQLAGSVAEMSSYHHGEASLMMTIINLAQNFVGSNNLNLLQPIGQFGTRLHGGKDSASPRYIFTMLSPLARLVFPPTDDNILRFLYDDNQRVEPEWYMPIIPMVLINGAEGIGTGWSCKIPNFDIREVVNNIRRLMDGEEPLPMLPSYKNFKGTIDELGPNQYVISGEVSILDSTTIEITELPVRTWTQTYKEQVLEPMLNGTEKTPPLITDYKEYHTDTTVKFIVKMTEEKLAEAKRAGLHKVFKLQTNLTCNSMVLFDHVGFLKKYDSPQDILKEFFELRLRYYGLRKEWLIGMIGAESAKLSNQARFILEKIDGKIVIENKPKKELIQVLIQRGYESDPVKAWKESQNKEEEEEEQDESDKESAAATGPDFNYLLNMPLWYLTKEKKDELCKQRDNKETELENLKRKSPTDLWKEDLAAFIEELDAVEAKQMQDEMAGVAGKPLKVKGGKVKVKKAQLPEVMPSTHGERVVPQITAEMKAEAEKRTKKKIKSEKNEFDENQEENTSGDKEPPSLKQRLVQKPKTEQGAKRQATLPFKPIKKTKKRNPWSDSGSDSESDFEAPPQRERVVRQAAAKVRTVISSDSEASLSSSEEEFKCQDDSEASTEPDINPKEKPAPKPKAAPKETTEKAAKAPKQKLVQSAIPVQVQDVANENTNQAPAAPSVAVQRDKAVSKKPAAAKKAAAAKDNQPSIMDVLTKKKAAPKSSKTAVKEERSSDLDAGAAGDKKPGPARGRKVTKRLPSISDSDSDSDFGSKPSKSVAAKKSKVEDNGGFAVESDGSEATVPCARPRRLKKPVQYLEESDEDDMV
ncbi:hypothetical protein AV530_001328 [Patagioenas fasciata monilis]|uniref:DNA topoisomerase 2 n=1 Tax=Patagioenas fasciata monilis TaxID=372326 RepID=A0A1V4JQM5_PATFA|nr:hypothetical protein AV530_001328 [Patagioenas fasciata monilis]